MFLKITCMLLNICPDIELRWIDNSPQVRGNNVTANLSVGSGISSLVCSVTGREQVDCEICH